MYYNVWLSYPPLPSQEEEEADYGESVFRRTIEAAGGELVHFQVRPPAAEATLGINIRDQEIGKFEVPRQRFRCPECGGIAGHKAGCKLGSIQKAISEASTELNRDVTFLELDLASAAYMQEVPNPSLRCEICGGIAAHRSSCPLRLT